MGVAFSSSRLVPTHLKPSRTSVGGGVPCRTDGPGDSPRTSIDPSSTRPTDLLVSSLVSFSSPCNASLPFASVTALVTATPSPLQSIWDNHDAVYATVLALAAPLILLDPNPNYDRDRSSVGITTRIPQPHRHLGQRWRIHSRMLAAERTADHIQRVRDGRRGVHGARSDSERESHHSSAEV